MNDFEVVNNGKTTFLQFFLGDLQIESTEIGMLLNNFIDGLAPVTLSEDKEKGGLAIRYEISQADSLAELFESGMSEGRLVVAMREMTAAIIHAEDYLLEMNKYCYDSRYVYFGREMGELGFIYIPVEDYKSEISFIEFCKNIIEELYEKAGRTQGYLNEIEHFLRQEGVTLPQFLSFLEQEEMDIRLGKKKGIELVREDKGEPQKSAAVEDAEKKEDGNLSGDRVVLYNSQKLHSLSDDEAYREERNTYILHKLPDSEVSKDAKIVRESTNEERFVTGSNYILGYSSELCQYSIRGNNSISRRHARIMKASDGSYSIQDLYTTNGTVVNGCQLKPGEVVPLRNGSSIILANEQFTFYILKESPVI